MPDVRLSRRRLIGAALGGAVAPAALGRPERAGAAQGAPPAPVIVARPIPALEPGTLVKGRKGDPALIEGRPYDAYIAAATKPNQFFHYTCEFDAAWAIFKTFGYEVGFAEQLAAVGRDESIEPYAQETPNGVVIYGGEVADRWCGNYETNFLARMRGPAMRKVFRAYGFRATRIENRADVKGALGKGKPVWAKATVDFLPWIPATWVTPSGAQYPTPYSNDHAVVAIGYNRDVVVIRDVLGPTSTNAARPYEYEVPWPQFEASLGSHGWDALAVAPPE